MSRLGLKETKEMVGFAMSLGNALGKSLADGEVSLNDLSNFIDPILEMPEAFNGAAEIPFEMGDFDELECQELNQFIKDKFDIPEESVEEVVECALGTLCQIALLVQKIESLR